jgi:hypothetical protein
MTIRTRRPRPIAEHIFHKPDPSDYVIPPPKVDEEKTSDPKYVEALKEQLEEWKKLAPYGLKEGEVDGPHVTVRWDKAAHDVALERYEKHLADVKLIFRPVLDEAYMEWPYLLNTIELEEAQRVEKLREEFKDVPKHRCHEKRFRTLEYLQADARLTKRIINESVIGAEGFDEFPSGVFVKSGSIPLLKVIEENIDYDAELDRDMVAELAESIVRRRMMLIAVTAAFRSQGLSLDESLL